MEFSTLFVTLGHLWDEKSAPLYVEKIYRHLQGIFLFTRYKSPDGKPLNNFGFDEEPLDAAGAIEALEWVLMVHCKNNVITLVVKWNDAGEEEIKRQVP